MGAELFHADGTKNSRLSQLGERAYWQALIISLIFCTVYVIVNCKEKRTEFYDHLRRVQNAKILSPLT